MSKIHIIKLQILLKLIYRLVLIQCKALLNLILFIVIYTYKNLTYLMTYNKKETKLEKIINYIKNNKGIIIQNLLLLLVNPSNILWYIIQAYTLIRMFTRTYDETTSNFLAFFLGVVRALITRQL